MEQYIKKSALVEEIKSRISNIEVSQKAGLIKKRSAEAKISLFKSILSFLNTIEVKDVNNVWHDANETPKGAGDKEILVQFADSHASVLEIDDWEYLDHQTKWAYLKDLI